MFFSTVILYDLQMADEEDVSQPKVDRPLDEKVSEVSKDEDEIVEGEVVESVGSDGEKGEADVDMVLKLEGMIKNNNSQITKISADLTEAREMLKDAFENDTTYREHADAAKDANKVKAATKAQILKQPQVAQIATNVKVLSSELKELKEALSDYLGEYNRLSGITEIEGDDGELLQIVYVAKLVRKPKS